MNVNGLTELVAINEYKWNDEKLYKIGYPEALCFGLAGGDGFENILVIEGGS